MIIEVLSAYKQITIHEAENVLTINTLLKLYSRAQRIELRQALPTLRMSYQIHSFLAGKQRREWSDFQEPYFELFNPPRESNRIADAPYSEDLIRCFHYAMKQKLISSQHLARLNLQALRDSGGDV